MVKKVTEPAFKAKKTTNIVRKAYPQQREDHLPKSTWEQLEEIYVSIATGLIDFSEQIRNHVQAIAQSGTEKTEAVNSIVRTTMQDMETFSKALYAIHMRHEGKKGVISDANGNAEHIQISMDYQDVFHRFQALSFQTVQVLMTHLQDVEDQLIERRKKEQEVNKDETQVSEQSPAV